jgi:very-short-patch-repair endonuclease
MSYRKYSDLSDKDKAKYLKQYYVDDGLSFADIAIKFDTYANRVRRDAKKLGIPIRDKSEAQINALNSGKHKHPTKGTKRDQSIKDKIGLSVMKSWEDMSDKELEQRKKKSKLAWEKLDEDQKANIIAAANQAVRLSSKTGSKLEKFLLTNLLSDGFVVEFHKEQILSNTKLQIDLFLPILNIAIEVDGPSHFLPVWGDDVLAKNQKYDKKKTGLIIGKGLSLIRIKQLNDYSKARALIVYAKLLEAIKEISNTKDKTIEIEDSTI